MKPYHPANLAHQPFPHWRVILLAWVGKLLGIQFKIDGIPYGAAYRPELWPRYNIERGRGSAPITLTSTIVWDSCEGWGGLGREGTSTDTI